MDGHVVLAIKCPARVSSMKPMIAAIQVSRLRAAAMPDVSRGRAWSAAPIRVKQEAQLGFERAARPHQALVAVDIRDQQARIRNLQPDGERIDGRGWRVVCGVRHHDIGMRPDPKTKRRVAGFGRPADAVSSRASSSIRGLAVGFNLRRDKTFICRQSWFRKA